MTGKGRRAATLPVSFFQQDAATVGRGLLGALLISRIGGQRTTGRIVEVEAYLGATDPASHAYQYRRHAQNASLYGEPGTWYVYRSYGVHWCANLVTGAPGEGAAVLLRAIEPLEGLATMRRRRGLTADGQLASGPGRLTEAFGITRVQDGKSMEASVVTIHAGVPAAESEVLATPRIGISRARELPLRFVLRDSRWLSRRSPRPGQGKDAKRGDR